MSLSKETSVFDSCTLQDIHAEIKKLYLSDQKPWIIGFSGGKDSTAALQLIWYAISELPPHERSKPVYVISSDTLVETPIIVNHIDTSLTRIGQAGEKNNLPFRVTKVKPITSETFWVNLIGKGYPAPQNQFRWCTDRMKIKPADRFILEKVSEHGEVILVLGVRKSESNTRAQVMSLHSIKGSILSKHTRFARAFVYTPIRNFSLDDVWGYLLQTPCPWGNNNRDLLALYQSATSEECPLVVDKTTPSCGNSRFGCWTCTVVQQDKTMEALIDSGHEWMQSLLEVRNLLASTQDPAVKPKYREFKRRRGTVDFNRDGTGRIIRGPYKLEFCQHVLKKLLNAQLSVRKNGPDPNIVLIGDDELHEIRRIWRTERGDWEDSLPEIYREVTGQKLPWVDDDIGGFGSMESELIHDVCDDKGLPIMLLKKLITAELQSQGMSRRSSIYSRIDRIMREEWRTEEEILRESEKQLTTTG